MDDIKMFTNDLFPTHCGKISNPLRSQCQSTAGRVSTEMRKNFLSTAGTFPGDCGFFPANCGIADQRLESSSRLRQLRIAFAFVALSMVQMRVPDGPPAPWQRRFLVYKSSV
jgi:hypothetical protein